MSPFGRDATAKLAFRIAPFLAFFVVSFISLDLCLNILQGAFELAGEKLDIQGHRGGRGDTIENTLPSFAWGLINGATTLELDNGITKDGAVVVWHDESITADKCQDTVPTFEGDPDFPYVGKHIVNLTLAQIKMLDCGSKRLKEFPLQLTYPGTRISTLKEVFAFASCADPKHEIHWNIESKINASHPDSTHGVDVFVEKQHAEFLSSPYPLSQIIYQSFDWRTLIAMKELDPRIRTSALISYATAVVSGNDTSPWQAGIRIIDMPGDSLDIKIAHAARTIDADILSPAFETPILEPNASLPSFEPFTTQAMVEKAHELKMQVIPWTVNDLDSMEKMMNWGIEGIITDHPNEIRRWARQRGYNVGKKYDERRVLECLQSGRNGMD